MYFVAGDSERLDVVRATQSGLAHPDERFMLDAPTPMWQPHRSMTAGPNVNTVLSGVAELDGRRWPLFFKPLRGVDLPTAHAYGQDSLVDVGLHEVAAWWLARELGEPWSGLVAPAVWLDPPAGAGIRESGSVSLGMGGRAELPPPGAGFEQMVSDAAFFDALIGSQDRHDQNLRAEPQPPRLGLIDHGFTFACPGDFHNGYPSAGFFQRLRYGQRWLPLPYAPGLDYSGMGSTSPQLQDRERQALDRLGSDRDLLGLAPILEAARANALRARADAMLTTGTVLPPGRF